MMVSPGDRPNIDPVANRIQCLAHRMNINFQHTVRLENIYVYNHQTL
jgi:hypothetical protein